MLQKLTEEQLRDILDSATREFAKKGYSNTSISRIAKSAGVSVGVIYKYYEDKEMLFLSCIRNSMKYLEESLLVDIQENDSLEDVCRQIVRANISFTKKHPDYLKMYNTITSDTGSEWTRKLAKEIEAHSAGIYRMIIEKAQAKGKISADINPGLYAFFFDNLMMMLHFAYSCEYYEERYRIFCGNDITDKDLLVEEQMIKFLSSAFGG